MPIYQQLCERGDSSACEVLVEIYAHGTLVPADAGKAAALYRRACDGRTMQACVELGELYEVGSGELVDISRVSRLMPTDRDQARARRRGAR